MTKNEVMKEFLKKTILPIVAALLLFSIFSRIFTENGFTIVYDRDVTQQVGDGFFFTLGYPGMTGGELLLELMYYGVSAICLFTTGSTQNGLRICTSFIEDRQLDELDRRMAIFEENNHL